MRRTLFPRFEAPDAPGSVTKSAQSDLAAREYFDTLPLDFATSSWCSDSLTLSKLGYDLALPTLAILARLGSCTRPGCGLGSHSHSPGPQVFPARFRDNAAALLPLSCSMGTRRPLLRDAHDSGALRPSRRLVCTCRLLWATLRPPALDSSKTPPHRRGSTILRLSYDVQATASAI